MAVTPPTERVRHALASLAGATDKEVLAAFEAARSGRYTTWTRPKGNGKVRAIASPAPELRRFQRVILLRVLYRAPTSPFAHGFAPGRSIATHARVHAETAKALLSVDLEDAYPSVSEERVRRTLEWALGPIVKRGFPGLSRAELLELYGLLSALCCFDGALPQGAPTSGALLNLACAGLDRRAARLVRRWAGRLPALRYSRYADDLAWTAAEPIPDAFVEAAAKIALRSGFRINRRKVHRTEARRGDLVLCGVRIHEGRLSLPRATLKRYRALFDQAARCEPGAIPAALRQKVAGTIGLVTMVTPCCPAPLERPLERLIARHPGLLRRRTVEVGGAGAGFAPYGP